jgi:hypothetical protein
MFWLSFELFPQSALSWNFSLAENLASLSLQDRATKWYYYQANPPHQISSFAGQLDFEIRIREQNILFSTLTKLG